MLEYIWLGVAAVMGLVEAFTLSLITMWFVVGALAAFVAALLGAGPAVQMTLFIAVSVLCLVALRPYALKSRMSATSTEPSLEGTTAIVCEPIPDDGMAGRVQTSGSMTWMAVSADGSSIGVGTPVIVVAQDSAKLIVERKQQ